MELQLVSAGDDVKIWDTTHFVLNRQLNPHSQNVGEVCWAADNSFLASASVHTNDVVLTYMKNYETTTLHTGAGCTCIDINDTSRYMLTGGSDGIISVWDLKTQKIRKNYKDHKGPVTCARFGQSSNAIAAGSETGEIIIYNVVTGQGCRPLVSPNVQAIRQVQFSRCKKSLLGAVSDDGSVNLWDTNRRQLINSFACHRAAATGLSFSPINDIFLLSVGLDKKMACHDVNSKQVVKIISADSPLTSIDTKGDGVTVVVGSTRGKIYHYDLRMGSVPVRILDAHKCSVQSLRFQVEHKVESSSNKQASLTAKQHLKQHAGRQLPASPRNNTGDYGHMEVQEMRTPASGAGEDVFSPLREGFQDLSDEKITLRLNGSFTNMDSLNNTQNTRNNTGDQAYSVGLGVFSPLNEGGVRNSGSGIGLSPLAYKSYPLSEQTSNIPGPTIMDYNRMNNQTDIPEIKVQCPSNEVQQLEYNEFSHHHSNRSDLASEATPISTTSQPYSLNFTDDRSLHSHKHVTFQSDEEQYAFLTNGASSSGESDRSPESKRQRQAHHQQVGRSASPSLTSMQLSDSPESAYGGAHFSTNHLPTTPEGVNPQSHVPNRTVKSPTQDSRLATNHVKTDSKLFTGDAAKLAEIVRVVVQEELSNFKKDVRSVVYDEVDEMRDQLHRDILNLHVELLKQFQQHQTEMLRWMEHYSVNPDLLAEIQLLQQEVKRLKRNF